MSEELQRLKAFTGFDKPFPFLRLPRELRDEIYILSLRAAKPVEAKLSTHSMIMAGDLLKPPAPGLLRVNKEIYDEAIDTLYATNIFRFQKPRHLLTFEKKIGAENRERVRQICICIHVAVVYGYQEYLIFKPGPERNPKNWIDVLKKCRLEKVVHLSIETEVIRGDRTCSLSVRPDLLECIEKLLGRGPPHMVPRLSLTGFREEEREKFSKKWKIVMHQRLVHKEEGMRQTTDKEYREMLPRRAKNRYH